MIALRGNQWFEWRNEEQKVLRKGFNYICILFPLIIHPLQISLLKRPLTLCRAKWFFSLSKFLIKTTNLSPLINRFFFPFFYSSINSKHLSPSSPHPQRQFSSDDKFMQGRYFGAEIRKSRHRSSPPPPHVNPPGYLNAFSIDHPISPARARRITLTISNPWWSILQGYKSLENKKRRCKKKERKIRFMEI